jgi:hypothetical protein
MADTVNTARIDAMSDMIHLEVVVITHSQLYLYTLYMTTSTHTLSPPLVGQWLYSSPLELNRDLVLDTSALHDAGHALVPFGPEKCCSDRVQLVLVDKAS